MVRLLTFAAASALWLACAEDSDAPCSNEDVHADGDADREGCVRLPSREGLPTGLAYCQTEQSGDLYRAVVRECVGGVPDELRCDDADQCDCGPGELCVMSGCMECACIRPCSCDSQCGAGFACLCATADPAGTSAGLSYSRCVAAECASDGDCPGGRCAVAVDGVNVPVALACRAESAECASHGDCPDLRCGYDRGRWSCSGFSECE